MKQVLELHTDPILSIGDAMTFVHVTELGYNFVLDKVSMVTY